MKTKKLFSTILLLAFLLTACGQGTAAPAPVTQTPVATQPPTAIPTQTLLPNLLPNPTAIPYPTASAVKSNAVAFISGNSLYVANVDGSGEKRLVDLEENTERISQYLLSWSPNGKWIGYISKDDLWIISPDGSINKKILSSQNTSKKVIRQYAWSPDGTKIAYTLAVNWGDFEELKTGLLDLITEKDFEISTYQPPANLVLSWSPDGHYILLNTDTSLKLFQVDIGKITKELRSACPIWHGKPSWSPDSERFFRFDYGTGYYYIWVYMNDLNGTSWQAVDGVISPPVWDKTGAYLYFVTGEMNLDIGPNWFTNQRLVRYDVKARKIEELLSLEEGGSTGYPSIMSLSPDGKKIELYSYIYYEDNSQYIGIGATRPPQNQFIIIDIQSLSKKTFTLELESWVENQPAWASDNEKIIFFSNSFYSLDVKTGDVSKFSGIHVVENAVISPPTTTP